jgi:hypothetical protein
MLRSSVGEEDRLRGRSPFATTSRLELMTQTPEIETSERGQFGIVVSIQDCGALGVRLTFDRVRRDGNGWRHRAFVTAKKLSREELLEMKIADDDLASIGLVLLAELCAAIETSHDTGSDE